MIRNRGSAHPGVSSVLAAAALLLVAAAVRLAPADQLLGIVVVAAAVGIFQWFPLHLVPAGALSLRGVILLPTLVLFGWPTAILAAALGMGLSLPLRSAAPASLEELADEVVAIGAAASVARAPLPFHSGSAAEVAAAAIGYFATLLILRTVRSAASGAAGIKAALSFNIRAGGLLAVVLTGVAAASTSTTHLFEWQFGRLAIPLIAAAAVLQLYLARIMRGVLQRRADAAVEVLARLIDAKDAYTGGHSAGVGGLSRAMAHVLDLPEPQAHRAYLAGLLHDVGKATVPDAILHKPGAHTPEERSVMRGHVEAGYEMLSAIEGFEEIANIVATSHEHVDGSGYPRGLRGDEIPIEARVNLVADAYSALTTDRVYRRGRSAAEALAEIESCAGTQFDPRAVSALRRVLGLGAGARKTAAAHGGLRLLRHRGFALLWAGELISFLGDEVFFIALSLWVYQLTHSATMLAITLLTATIGQGLLGMLAGALADRLDRRGVIIATDLGRALLTALLPIAFVHSLPLGLLVLLAANIGTIFFRTALLAALPDIVPEADLTQANAMFETTARIAEVAGGVLGGALVAAVGAVAVFYINAASFLASAVCVGLIPLAWGTGLYAGRRRPLAADVRAGLRYMWHTPIQRFLALLILPSSALLAFNTVLTPMVLRTAHLDALAFGAVNSALGAGKLIAAIGLAWIGGKWVRESFVVGMFVLGAAAVGLFAATTMYATFIVAAFLFGVSNMSTIIGNVSLVMGHSAPEMRGRIVGTRQTVISLVKAGSMLAFGRLADSAGPPAALFAIAAISGVGVLVVASLARNGRERRAAPTPAT